MKNPIIEPEKPAKADIKTRGIYQVFLSVSFAIVVAGSPAKVLSKEKISIKNSIVIILFLLLVIKLFIFSSHLFIFIFVIFKNFYTSYHIFFSFSNYVLDFLKVYCEVIKILLNSKPMYFW
jgi:hypothetical protein